MSSFAVESFVRHCFTTLIRNKNNFESEIDKSEIDIFQRRSLTIHHYGVIIGYNGKVETDLRS